MSFRASHMQGLASFRNLSHQRGSRLQIPVSVSDVGVSEIGAEPHHVTRYRGPISSTALERPNSKGVSQVMDTRPSLTGLAPESNGAGHLQEHGCHSGVSWRLSRARDEHRLLGPDNSRRGRQIGIQSSPRRLVHGNETALTELRLSNNEPIGSYVVAAQGQSFGDAQPRRREEAEKCHIRERSDRP